jgi:cell division protein FtsW
MLRPGQAIVLCVLSLLCLGVVMVNSADMTLGNEGAVTMQSIILSRSTAYMVMALIALLAMSLLPVRRLAAAIGAGEQQGEREPGPLERFIGPVAMWVCVGVLLATLATVYVPVIGREINGSHRWLEVKLPAVGKVSLQPSEIAKWGMVVLLAWYATRAGARMGRFWSGLLPALAAAGVIAGFIVLEDLGTGVLIGAVAAIVLLAGGARWWHLGLLAPVAAGALYVAVASSEYRMKRLTAFLDPYADPEKTGFHMIQSMTAVANGEVSGRGLGFGLQKFGYLPEDRTDFLFAVICEELGVAGAALVVALYIGLLWAGYLVMRRERNPMLKLVALGILSTVGIQAVINLAVVTGLGPTKGIALPLLSSGGTGWILTAASLGLIVAMDRHQAVEEHEPDMDGDAGETSDALPASEASEPASPGPVIPDSLFTPSAA